MKGSIRPALNIYPIHLNNVESHVQGIGIVLHFSKEQLL